MSKEKTFGYFVRVENLPVFFGLYYPWKEWKNMNAQEGKWIAVEPKKKIAIKRLKKDSHTGLCIKLTNVGYVWKKGAETKCRKKYAVKVFIAKFDVCITRGFSFSLPWISLTNSICWVHSINFNIASFIVCVFFFILNFHCARVQRMWWLTTSPVNNIKIEYTLEWDSSSFSLWQLFCANHSNIKIEKWEENIYEKIPFIIQFMWDRVLWHFQRKLSCEFHCISSHFSVLF